MPLDPASPSATGPRTAMSAIPRRPIIRLTAAPAVLFVAAVAVASQTSGDAPKAPPATAPAPKEVSKDKALGTKLADGTFLWTGPAADGERLLLSPQEHQKLLDQIEQLKKQLAARKGVAPSG